MTDHDKKLQRAELQVEFEDAESDLAHLREKATRLAQGLREVAGKVEMNAGLIPSGDDFDMEAELERRLRPQHHELFDYAKTIAMIAELKTARQKIYNLQLRKSSLMQPSGIRIAV